MAAQQFGTSHDYHPKNTPFPRRTFAMTIEEQQTFHLMTAVIAGSLITSAGLFKSTSAMISQWETYIATQPPASSQSYSKAADIAATAQAIANFLIRSNLAVMPDVTGE